MKRIGGQFLLAAALLVSPVANAQRPAAKANPEKPAPAKDGKAKDEPEKKSEPVAEPAAGAPLPPAPAAPAGAAVPKKSDDVAASKEPGVTGEAAVDTRSTAMRAYYQALEKRRMAAASPLSIQRLREELPVDRGEAVRRPPRRGDRRPGLPDRVAALRSVRQRRRAGRRCSCSATRWTGRRAISRRAAT